VARALRFNHGINERMDEPRGVERLIDVVALVPTVTRLHRPACITRFVDRLLLNNRQTTTYNTSHAPAMQRRAS